MENSKYVVYFGSYTDKELPGIYSYLFDEDSEDVDFIESISGLQDPTFIKISEAHNMLYSFTQSYEGLSEAAAASYRIDPATGKLAFVQQELSADKAATHINTDHAERFLLTVSYGGGTISLFPILSDGTIGELVGKMQHSGGSGVVPQRQESPHPHSVYTDPSDQFVIVPDLGLDKVMVYRLDRLEAKLVLHDEVSVAPGAGPRHFAFHPNGSYAYVIEELSSTITVFSYDRVNGKLQSLQTVNTLPADYTGTSSTAEVQVSPCGGYLYGSNRGHDSIVVFSIDPLSGMLTLVQHISTSGKHPRHFSLTPSGRFLLAANKDSDSVYWFRVDKETGQLEETGRQIVIPQPTCVRFYKLP
ncbi:lactonase family protein [Paenibacillus agricola]|uniref:Lactonase family protein n=1 Tax=Paenibacillus agricola TaxID=2716264 RepID=A0ABX0JGT2_9BACL|nr:lactonase family protein [Paenibacillus agricola]NHN33474.1 lactonase family protein [Paenibacillus agricola]